MNAGLKVPVFSTFARNGAAAQMSCKVNTSMYTITTTLCQPEYRKLQKLVPGPAGAQHAVPYAKATAIAEGVSGVRRIRIWLVSKWECPDLHPSTVRESPGRRSVPLPQRQGRRINSKTSGQAQRPLAERKRGPDPGGQALR